MGPASKETSRSRNGPKLVIVIKSSLGAGRHVSRGTRILTAPLLLVTQEQTNFFTTNVADRAREVRAALAKLHDEPIDSVDQRGIAQPHREEGDDVDRSQRPLLW